MQIRTHVQLRISFQGLHSRRFAFICQKSDKSKQYLVMVSPKGGKINIKNQIKREKKTRELG